LHSTIIIAMKLPQTLSLLVIAAIHISGSYGNPQNLRRRVATAADGMLYTYGQIMSGDSRIEACIELPTTAYNQIEKNLILGDCKMSSGGWRFGHHGQIHSEWNDDYCIQVAAHEGAHLKLLPCDTDNTLQRFVYHNHGEAMHPKSNDALCVTYEGNHADVGTDLLVVKECDKIKSQRHWIGTFPRSEDENEEEEATEEGMA